MSDLITLVLAAKDAVPALLLERRRLEFAVARHDKEGMREINKTFKHLYLDLRELYNQIASLTGDSGEIPEIDYEDWFLPNQATIGEKELNSRLITYYCKLREFIRALESIATGVEQAGMKVPFFHHLLGHVHLTTLLFRFDLETITGENIQP